MKNEKRRHISVMAKIGRRYGEYGLRLENDQCHKFKRLKRSSQTCVEETSVPFSHKHSLNLYWLL